jgi:hypothetical protein
MFKNVENKNNSNQKKDLSKQVGVACYNKKLLYLTTVNKDNDPGVYKKIRQQAECFSRFGYTVSLVYYSQGEFYCNDVPIAGYKKNLINNLIERILYPAALQKIIKSFRFDVIYVRKSFINRGFLNSISEARRNGTCCILEIPTFPYEKEIRGLIKQMLYQYERYCSKRAKNSIDLIVYCGDWFGSIWGCNTICISNGFDVNSVPINNGRYLTLDQKQCVESISFVFIANISPWHGLERMLKSLFEYSSIVSGLDVYLNIVGEGESISEIKQIVQDLAIGRWVTFHGILDDDGIKAVVEKSDIAVGSLGMFKSGITKASTLKAREYAARGLPFILGYEDPAFMSANFVYLVKNDETIFSLSEIIKWWKNNDFKAKQIRQFALDNLSWDCQINSILIASNQLSID